MAGSEDEEAGVKRNKGRWRAGKQKEGIKDRGRKEKCGGSGVGTSRALRRSRRGLVVSLSSSASAWLASGSAFGGSPASGSV